MKDEQMLSISDRTHTTHAEATSTSYSSYVEHADVNSTALHPTGIQPHDPTAGAHVSYRSYRPLFQGQQPPTKDEDSFSISSRLSLNSTTDGIDVLGAPNGPAKFRNWSHLTAARIVCSVIFKRTVLLLILISTTLLGLRTFDIVRQNELLRDSVNYTLEGLVVVFALEAIVSIVCYQDKLFSVGWLATDVMILFLIIMVGDVSLLALRSFRLLRALRKASGVPALKWAVKAILRVLPRLVAVVAILLPGMFIIFAILFTNLYQDAQLRDDESGEQLMSEDYFGRLDVSALTLFQIMTGGRNWSVVCTELQAQYPSAWVPLVCFVIVAVFFFGSLIIAVMCDAVSNVNRDRMWKSLDPNHSSSIAPTTTPTTTTYNASGPCDGLLYGGQKFAMPYCEPETTVKSDLRRLEGKLDDLTRTIDTLLRINVVLQESMNALTERELSRQVLMSQRSRSARTSLTMIPDVTKAQSDDL